MQAIPPVPREISLLGVLFGFLRAMCAALMLLALISCSQPPHLVGIDSKNKPAASVREASRQKIFIATTRQASEVTGAFYSGERAPDLGLASVVVSIPPNHEPGKLERPKKMPPDPETEFAVVEPTVYRSDGAFLSALNSSLSELPPKDRNVLFFVHGYNNTVSDSILRLAQFVEDSNYNGVAVLFSWASAAKSLQYVYDLNSVIAARSKLREASSIVVQAKANQFDILAHSMGSFLTMEAIVHAELAGEFNKSRRIRNIVLAAPDIDIEVFQTQLELITHDNQKIFVLVSQDDGALSFSKAISGGVDRVGAADADELAKFGVSVFDLSKIKDSTSGSHSKFAGSPEVVQLIGRAIETSSRFGRRTQPELIEFIAGAPILIVSD